MKTLQWFDPAAKTDIKQSADLSVKSEVVFADVIKNITRVNNVLQKLINNYEQLQKIYKSKEMVEGPEYSSESEYNNKQKNNKRDKERSFKNDMPGSRTTGKFLQGTQIIYAEVEGPDKKGKTANENKNKQRKTPKIEELQVQLDLNLETTTKKIVAYSDETSTSEESKELLKVGSKTGKSITTTVKSKHTAVPKDDEDSTDEKGEIFFDTHKKKAKTLPESEKSDGNRNPLGFKNVDIFKNKYLDGFQGQDANRNQDGSKSQDENKNLDGYKSQSGKRDLDGYKNQDEKKYQDSYKNNDGSRNQNGYKKQNGNRNPDSYKSQDANKNLDLYKNDGNKNSDVDRQSDGHKKSKTKYSVKELPGSKAKNSSHIKKTPGRLLRDDLFNVSGTPDSSFLKLEFNPLNKKPKNVILSSRGADGTRIDTKGIQTPNKTQFTKVKSDTVSDLSDSISQMSDDDAALNKDKFKTSVLRQAYGDACLRLVVRKCYKAIPADQTETPPPIAKPETKELNILRDRYEKACQRQSQHKCDSACFYAHNATCVKFECSKQLKKNFRRNCKSQCKMAYVRGKSKKSSRSSSGSSGSSSGSGSDSDESSS
ncbi:unnamed protein product [Chrysodeixis includens]|uniref:Uncharacterized protein n=1 Tax=Chrysodeixis includens TaxID=689277 RepID=A0A9N8L7Q3_CHRIL|nr:unnamed protein product [Chrysodeixis includens]